MYASDIVVDCNEFIRGSNIHKCSIRLVPAHIHIMPSTSRRRRTVSFHSIVVAINPWLYRNHGHIQSKVQINSALGIPRGLTYSKYTAILTPPLQHVRRLFLAMSMRFEFSMSTSPFCPRGTLGSVRGNGLRCSSSLYIGGGMFSFNMSSCCLRRTRISFCNAPILADNTSSVPVSCCAPNPGAL